MATMTTDGTARTAETSAVFAALASPRRRDALRVLLDEAAAVPLDELAARIGALAADRGSPANVTEIRTTLHHVHLPVLVDADLVTVEGNDRSVRPGEGTGTAVDALDGARDLLAARVP